MSKTRKIKKTDTYVINLDEATERWEQIQKDFKNTNLNLIRVPAVKNEEEPRQGLLDSFKNIIYMAKEKKLESVLILEDDSYPTAGFNKRWSIIKKWLDNNKNKWEIFNGGARLYNIKKRLTKIFLLLNNNIKIYKSDYVMACNFLYINSDAYDKILSWNFYNNKKALDHFTGDYRIINMIYSYPLLSKQHDGFSYINNNNRSNDNIYKELKIYIKNIREETPLIVDNIE